MSELEGLLSRLWADLIARPGGPFEFRFVVQPLVAALRDGVSDARTGRSPYAWTVLHDPARGRERLREGVKATLRVVLLGFAPYLLIRGPTDRIARRRRGDHHGKAGQAQHSRHLGR